MGNESLKRLLQLPIQAIEFGAFGGANFCMVELMRRDKDECDIYKPLAYVGQTAEQMEMQSIICPEVLISYASSSLFPEGLKISSMDITL